jgi:hypothetical protein
MAFPIREPGAPLLCGDCGGHRARSWSTRRDVSSPDHCELSLVGCCPSTRAPIRREAVGHMHLDHAEYFDLCWAESAAVRVDDGLGDVAYLDMAVFGRDAPAVTRPAQGDGEALGRHSDLLPPGQSVLELCDLRLQLRRPGAGLQARRLSQPLLAAAARPCVTSMTSRPQTQGGDRSETQERRRPLKLSQ